MSFFDAFIDELKKIAEEIADPQEPAPPEYVDPKPTFSEGPPDSSSEKIVDEGRADSPEPDAVAGFASSETRRDLQSMLKDQEGRREIRETLSNLTRKANEFINSKRALTRSLLRARRDAYGPSATPRRDLRALLFSAEPFFDASVAR